jgi:CheY-like chemotaxis protein
MPAMNGIEFVKEIRKLNDRGRDVKIIVMSAFELSELGIDEKKKKSKHISINN